MINILITISVVTAFAIYINLLSDKFKKDCPGEKVITFITDKLLVILTILGGLVTAFGVILIWFGLMDNILRLFKVR